MTTSVRAPLPLLHLSTQFFLLCTIDLSSHSSVKSGGIKINLRSGAAQMQAAPGESVIDLKTATPVLKLQGKP